ncbi:MAG: peptide ABC transporter substrate-binding protein [Ruminococcaceae bacterium]|nr:peptide ABC transporter substrate-binding protein [Oscillospiraceae bacterium]
MTKKIIALMLCLVMVCLAMASCDGSDTSSTDASEQNASNVSNAETEVNYVKDGVYRVLYSGELSTLNYLTTSNSNEMTVGANTVDSLVEYDPKGALKAGLAESWTYDEATLTWTFKIREGQKWVDHTGAAKADVTANDFVSALKYSLNPANESSTVQNLFGKIKNAEEYYNGLAFKDAGGKEFDDDGNEVATWAEISFDEVGVKAVDNYTLTYTLVEECPYFLSSLTYITYLPVYGPMVEEMGKEFATAADKMYYCGAYYLSEFVPNEKRTLKRNDLNYDADMVYIAEIKYIYNAESEAVAPDMVLKNEIDYADIDTEVADDWLANEEKLKYISQSRASVDYSYFYCFNFDPKFDAEYEPENWKIAVNNEDFRKAVLYAMNKNALMGLAEANNPEEYVYNTITLSTFCTNNDGKDFSALAPFDGINATKTGDAEKAVSYRDAAKTALTAAGATFPVKMLVSYNPNTTSWDGECGLLEQQLETVLGADFIDVVVVAGPSSNFLTEVRRSGKYAFMKCNWGADYQDPETWTDPFYQESVDDGYKYNFMYQSVVDGGASAEVIKGYYALVKAAKEIKSDINARYEAFAKAEAYLIDHALVIPYGASPAGYVATKLNTFEGQFASFGISTLRYKGQKLYDHFITMEEFVNNKNAVEGK